MSDPTPGTLPRGRHAVPREVVERSQRERLLEAMAGAVADGGYTATSVADVLARAGVSRKTFYEHFANKEECFLVAYDHGVEQTLGALEGAIAAEDHPYLATAAGTRAYLAWLDAHPAFARTFVIEVLAAGPRALARRAAVHERFAVQLRAIYADARAALPALPEVPPHRFSAVVGATNELVLEHVRTRGAVGLEAALAEPMLDVVLAMLVGSDLAEALRPEAGGGGAG